MVRRKGWRKQKANSGAVLYFVPVGEERPREDSRRGNPTGDDGMAALLASKDQTIAALEGHVSTLQGTIEEMQRELALWRASGWWRRRLRRAAWRRD